MKVQQPFRMPFGRYEGRPLEECPLRYLVYVLGFKGLLPETRSAIASYMQQPLNVRQLRAEMVRLGCKVGTTPLRGGTP